MERKNESLSRIRKDYGLQILNVAQQAQLRAGEYYLAELGRAIPRSWAERICQALEYLTGEAFTIYSLNLTIQSSRFIDGMIEQQRTVPLWLIQTLTKKAHQYAVLHSFHGI